MSALTVVTVVYATKRRRIDDFRTPLNFNGPPTSIVKKHVSSLPGPLSAVTLVKAPQSARYENPLLFDYSRIVHHRLVPRDAPEVLLKKKRAEPSDYCHSFG